VAAASYAVCFGRGDSRPATAAAAAANRPELMTGGDVMASLHRARRLDLAAAAADANDDDGDEDATSTRYGDVTRIAVRPWLLSGSGH